ncbi:MAG: DUF4097 family beta strand repeat protein [Colwellia sp.]|nr:DUF4097 family beta strand repeat protein [Colwellia sp.]
MKNSFKKQLTLATLLSLSMITVVYADVEDTIEKSFDVSENATLRLANINGAVEIKGWDRNEIKVTAIITAKNQEDRDRIKVEFDQSSSGVSVETEYEKQLSWGRNNSSGKVDYTVMVPFGASLTDIELVNGSLVIDKVQGEIKANTVNGSINVQGLADDLELNSVNGSIKATYQHIDNNIDEIELTTVNGSIKLYLPSELNATINAETMHGSIKTGFGLSSHKKMFSGRSLSGSVGSGDIKIDLESVNGSIKVMKN